MHKLRIQNRWRKTLPVLFLTFAVIIFIFISSTDSYAFTVEDVAELNKKLVNLDFQAYGYIFAQKYSVESCAQKCPQSARELKYMQGQMDLKFAESIKRIRSKYRSKIDFSDYDAKLMSKVEKSNNLSSISCSDCMAFTNELQHRVDGNIPEPIYAALVRNNPIYRKQPDMEYSDGLVYEWKSHKDNLKLHGIRMSLKHPVSWNAKDGRGPHIVKKFTNDYGYGVVTFMIQIRDLPESGIERFSKKDINDFLEYTTTYGYIGEIAKGARIISTGRVTINNHEASFVVFKQTIKNMKTPVNVQSIMYILVADGKLILLQGIVGAPKTKGSDNVSTGLFNKYEKLFELMASSLYIYNQFEINTGYHQRSSTIQ